MHSRAEARTHRQAMGAGLRARVTQPCQLVGFTLARELARCSLGALALPPDLVPRLPARTAGFFLWDRAILSSLRSVGES